MAQVGIQPHIVDRVLNHNVASVRAHRELPKLRPREKRAVLKRASKLSEYQKRELIQSLQAPERVENGSNCTERTLFDSFAESKMIGALKEAPADWSSNPKYMKRFGTDPN